MISIVDFNLEKHSYAFRDINYKWIEQYFTIEAMDRKALLNPKLYILDKGGAILIAEENGIPIGTCALIPMDHPKYNFELAKMGVYEESRGKKIGYNLGIATIKKAKSLAANAIYLESNSKLRPAIQLYKKLGFKMIKGIESPYSRCDIQMEIIL